MSDGYAFDAGFLKQLPDVEKAMIAHNLDPSAFTITKGPNSSYRAYNGTGRYSDYAVDTGDDSFTVTYASDAGFLEFFLGACVAPDDSDSAPGHPIKPRSREHHQSSLIDRLARWFRPHH
jgi:hypothetical protein